MTNYSKYKIGLLSFSTFILLYIFAFENAFFSTSIINNWQKLSWNDFDGIVQPFNKHSASIHADIYIKYDSVNKNFIAYSGQNNKLSWKKNGLGNDTLLLHHEQYHFNITEYHSRLMNKYLNKKKAHSAEDYELELKNIRERMWKTQEKYDEETNHSLNIEQQSFWENKIEELLK